MDDLTFKKDVEEFADIYCSEMLTKIKFEKNHKAVITVKDFHLKQDWEVPVYVDNDANSIAIVEQDYEYNDCGYTPADGEGLYKFLWLEALKVIDSLKQ